MELKLKEFLLKNKVLAVQYGKHLPKYIPKKDCSFCKGLGIKIVHSTGQQMFCICTFVHHNHSEEKGRKFAKKQLRRKL